MGTLRVRFTKRQSNRSSADRDQIWSAVWSTDQIKSTSSTHLRIRSADPHFDPCFDL